MADYEITAPDGRRFRISGDSPPTEQELEEIFATMSAPSPEADPNTGMGPLDTALVAAGRGLTTIGRGLGLAEPEDPIVTRSFNRLSDARPVSAGIGEVLGEAAPFLIPGTGVGAIGNAGLRIAASAGLGGLEGGLISSGQGQEFTGIMEDAAQGGALAGLFEAVLPHAGRLGRKLYSNISGEPPSGALFSGGNPTAELEIALNRQAVPFPHLSQDSAFTLQNLPAGVNPDEVARATRFRELGIPATRGDVTQDFVQQATEQRLAHAGSVAGEPLRDLQLRQSDAFRTGVENLVSGLGVTEETGEVVKDALTGRLANLKTKKNQLYKQIAQEAPDVLNMPIFGDEVLASLPDEANMRRVSRLPGNGVDALRELLVEFGVDNSPESVEAFTKKGGEIIPLTIGTYEEFRQALNQIGGSPSSLSSGERATSGIVGKLKEGLDKEASFIEEALLEQNAAAGRPLDSLREARRVVQTMKREFSPQSIAGRLTNVKADGVTPIVEASKVYDSVLGGNQPIEYLERTLESLKQAGNKGKQGIAALQSATILRALDDALKAPSRKSNGIETLGYTQFLRSLRKVGDDKLSALFADNPRTLQRLKMYQQTAKDLTPDNRAVPKGSAPVLMDIVNRMSRAPIAAPVVDVLKFVVNAGADDRAVRRALDSTPEGKRIVSAIQNDYPSLASAIGIAYMGENEEQ